ncbi:type II toxin-antitoxin system VapC family toxin [Marinobacter sp.]|uniref:type II toxin-antitoxin system VapC family toxin n=1 Tax=Marinobacter sp. TaxID=50741 RepID=UPI003A9193A1
MNVLVDTSVWVDHFRNHNTALTNLLLSDRALTHPMVVAELACGTPPAPRKQTLGDISLLQPATQASLDEIRELIEREKLYGLGCGLIDIALLASTLITPDARLWTFDKRLASLALRFDVSF